MRAGNWPDRDVRHFDVVARFDGGPPVAVESMRLTHSMIDGHPSGHSGGLSTSGHIDVATDVTATSLTPEPWSRSAGFPPRSGTPVTIDITDGEGQSWRRLTGITERAEGSFSSRTVRIPVRDAVDRLGVVVTSEPVLETHPPMLDGGPYRRTRVCAEWLLDRAARAGGFYATPQHFPILGCRLSVPMVGSLWPERGTLRFGQDTTGGLPDRDWSDTHIGMRDVSASWEATSSTRTPEVTTAILPQAAGQSMRVTATATSGAGVYVTIDSTDTIRYGTILSGALTQVGTLAKGAATRVGFAVTTTSGGTVGITVRTDTGASTYGSGGGYDFADLDFINVHAYGTGALGWLQMGSPPPEWKWIPLTEPITARHLVGADGIEQWDAAPQVWDTTAIDLIADWARATCGHAWIDMDGHLQIAARDSLGETSDYVLSLTSEESLLDVGWVDDGMHVARQVRVTHQHPKIQRSRYTSWRVWQAPSQTLESGDEPVVTSLEIPDNEDWVDVDAAPHLVTNATTGSDILRNTVVGGMLLTGSETTSATPAIMNASMVADGPRAWEVSVSPWDQMDPSQSVVTCVPEGMTTIPLRYRGLPLPDVKARARVYRLERVATFDTNPGDYATVQLHEHDAGWWVQELARRSLIHTYLKFQMGEQQPAPTDVSIAPDLRVELGDIVTLDDSHRTGVRVVMLTTHIDTDFDAGSGLSMSVGGRLLGWALFDSMEPDDAGHEPTFSWEAT